MSISTRHFLNVAFNAAVRRDPTRFEFMRLRSSLNHSYVAGTILTDAQKRLKTLFLTSEYTGLSTSDGDFITDTYAAYLDRVATGGEVTSATTYLGGHTRAEFLDTMGALSEFSDRVDTILPAIAYPVPDLGGPRPLKFTPADADYESQQSVATFVDGGIAVDTKSDFPVQRWALDYDGLSPDEAAILDEHRDDAMGMEWDFDFTDREGNLWASVRYDTQGFTPDHTNVEIQKRSVILIWRP